MQKNVLIYNCELFVKYIIFKNVNKNSYTTKSFSFFFFFCSLYGIVIIIIVIFLLFLLFLYYSIFLFLL